ncbi:hypothetical protein HRG_012237 [Hirsutella rhossiliensis]
MTFNTNEVKCSRSRGAILTLRDLAARPSSPGRASVKRVEADADLSPPSERSGTQPSSPEKLRRLHAAMTLFKKSISQPHIELGTPIPPTQQSSRFFRALAPSPAEQPATDPVASHFDPSTARGNATRMNYSYLAARFHKGGRYRKMISTAGARVKLAAIQRDHRSRRRAGETVSLTPSISQLGVSEGSGVLDKISVFGLTGKVDASRDRPQPNGDQVAKEGNRDQFSEPDMDAEDYFNLLLSPLDRVATVNN